MAGERKGKAYEAIVFVALEELKRRRLLKGEIFWNETPEGMTIEPDFTIGVSKDDPGVVLLVTHSGSAKNSDMKFWRNMGELAEAKVRLPRMPRVYSIAFDSVIKEELKKLQAASFDGQLVVGDLAYGRQLQGWVEKVAPRLPKDGPDQVAKLRDACATDSAGKRLLGCLCIDLQKLLSSRRRELDALWTLERQRPARTAPTARKTSVRRGISKLLIIEDQALAIRLFTERAVAASAVPGYAFSLGLAGKAIGGAVGRDPEIRGLFSCLSREVIQRLLRMAPMSRLDGWLRAIRESEQLVSMGRYVVKNYEQLCKPELLEEALRRLYERPAAIAPPGGWPQGTTTPATVWLLEYLLELVRHSTGSANGYGYAQLARDVADSAGPARRYPKQAREHLLSPWGHLSEWLHRVTDAELPPGVLGAVAAVLAARLQQIDRGRIEADLIAIAREATRNTIEAKLLTYNGFDPLSLLIRDALPKSQEVALRVCFAEAAGLRGRAGKTSVWQVGRTLVNWQSVSDAGRDHKKKELCGRAAGLRYTWDSRLREFRPRPGVSKLTLVLDGTWRQDDLDALVRAGWDEVFYPDEMGELAAAIV